MRRGSEFEKEREKAGYQKLYEDAPPRFCELSNHSFAIRRRPAHRFLTITSQNAGASSLRERRRRYFLGATRLRSSVTRRDRKRTPLNSSHLGISYAVF